LVLVMRLPVGYSGSHAEMCGYVSRETRLRVLRGNMALNINARLKRTQRGQSEVRQKSHTLTQGERLILVLVDGVMPTDQVSRKLRGMSERRFKLAIADLIAKGFVEETVPALDDRPEVLEREIIENYVG
jgi:hypothetical protein